MDAFVSTDPNALTRMMQFTPTMHRQIYEAISPKNPRNSARGKNVLVTGATRGIGKAIALSWAEAGAAGIAITGRVESLLQEVVDEIKKISPASKVLALAADATSRADVDKMWAKVKTEIGNIDVLICNAGINLENDRGFPRIGSFDPADWLSVLTTNIYGAHLNVYNFLQQYVSIGEEPTGTVIFIGSGAAMAVVPGGSAYSISKSVNARQAESLSAEYPRVRAFSVHPGMVPTQMSSPMLANMTIDSAELAGGLSLYLSSGRADFLNGKFLSVNWDVNEMEQHAEEIQEKGLLSMTFIKATLGPEGHPFEMPV